MKTEIWKVLTEMKQGDITKDEAVDKLLFIFSVMQAEVSDGAKEAAVASEGQGEANTCADCGRTKDEDGTCYSCEYGAMFGH